MDRQTARSLARGTKVVHRTLGSGTWSTYASMDGPTAAWIHLDGDVNPTLIDFTGVEVDVPRIQHQRWSWVDGDQIDLTMLARDLAFVSRGTVFLYPMATHRDDLGFVLSDRELTEAEAQAAAGMNPKDSEGDRT